MKFNFEEEKITSLIKSYLLPLILNQVWAQCWCATPSPFLHPHPRSISSDPLPAQPELTWQMRQIFSVEEFETELSLVLWHSTTVSCSTFSLKSTTRQATESWGRADVASLFALSAVGFERGEGGGDKGRDCIEIRASETHWMDGDPGEVLLSSILLATRQERN